MSRIGKKPIAIPKGVTVKVEGDTVDVKGPKGHLRQPLPPGIDAAIEDGQLLTRKSTDERALDKFHGLARSLVNNAVVGVTDGWKRELDIVGVGYRAEMKGQQIVLALGYSHPIVFDVPHGHRGGDREADAPHGDRRRSAAGRPGGGEPAPAAAARPVSAEGRALHRRSAEEEGWKDGRVSAARSGSGRSGDVMQIKTKDDRRQRIKYRIRKRMRGTSERPRLSVFRSVVAHLRAGDRRRARGRRWRRPRAWSRR